MAGDRQLVRQAVAAYFGGSLETADAGIYYQNGPLTSYGLGTAYPYLIKKGAPDQYYTWGQPDGQNWGAVLSVKLLPMKIDRMAEGGPVSGWRARHYLVRCDLDAISYQPHLETTEAAFDNLIDELLDLVYADRTLGTTSVTYATGRLITQAGEGRAGITVGEADWQTETDRGRGEGGLSISFEALTMVEA